MNFNLSPLIWVKATTLYDLRYAYHDSMVSKYAPYYQSLLFVLFQFISKQFNRVHRTVQDERRRRGPFKNVTKCNCIFLMVFPLILNHSAQRQNLNKDNNNNPSITTSKTHSCLGVTFLVLYVEVRSLSTKKCNYHYK